MEKINQLLQVLKINSQSVLVIGQEKGDNLETRIERNFGMMRPEGYRNYSVNGISNKFNIPIISFIDTPRAYPRVSRGEDRQKLLQSQLRLRNKCTNTCSSCWRRWIRGYSIGII